MAWVSFMKKPSFKLGILKRLSSKGFSLAEVMVSVGFLGIIAVAVMSQQKQSVKSATVVETDVAINDILRTTIGEISDQSTCTANFGGQPQVKTYASLKNSASNQAFLSENGIYGSGGTSAAQNTTSSGEVKLKSIKTVQANPVSPYTMILRLSFQRKSTGGVFNLLDKEIIRDIPINTVLDASNNITSCFGDYNLLAQSAVESACLKVSAETTTLLHASKYERPSAAFPYGRCLHMQQDVTCDPGKFLKRVYVESDPTTTAPVVKYECVNMQNSCTAGQYIKEFKSDGTVVCDYAIKTCPAGQLVVRNGAGVYVCKSIDCRGLTPVSAFGGFDANGDQICNPITSLKDCGTDNFAVSVTPGGSINCNPMKVSARDCGPNQRMSGIDSTGTPICTKFITLPINCGGGNALKSIDSNGDAICDVKRVPMACDGGHKNHSQFDCTNAGGTVINANTPSSRCLFSGYSTCPATWSRCSLWGGQATAQCTDTSNTYYCSGNIQTRYAVNGGGAEVNGPLATTTCYSWNGASNNNKACNPVPYTTATTIQTSVGCY